MRMTTSHNLFLSILALDAYNRGYGSGFEDDDLGETIGTMIGQASILGHTDSTPGSPDREAGFYAVAYQIGSQTVISYRGTDSAGELFSDDAPIISGFYNDDAVYQATKFYDTVRDQVGDNARITLTGHSLGGGLAGFVAGTFGQRAVLVDHVAFYGALVDFQADYQLYLQFANDQAAYQYYIQNGGTFVVPLAR
jgi:fermentation-respiration switch protein FrsA (DUF1100 family)